MNSYDVRFWSTKTNRKKNSETGKLRVVSYTVRWTVGGREKSQTFKNKEGAKNFLSDLRQSAKNGEAFDTESGLPESMREQETATSLLAYCVSYVAKRWERDAPNTRKGVLEALATVVPAVTRDLPHRPAERTLYRAVCHFALPPADRNTDSSPPPLAIAAALRWVERASLPVSSLMDEDVLTAALDALTVNLDGKPAAANTVARKRSVFYNALDKAAKGKNKLLSRNPMPGLDWRPDKAVEQLDRRVVCNPRQAAELLTAVTYVGSRDPLRGRRLAAMFACMYYAGLRPSETVALRADDCELPATGWGMLHVAASTPEAGTRYTGTDTRHDDRGLKHRSPDDVRPVPIPPRLVRMLREHIHQFGTGTSDRLFRQSSGNLVATSSYCDVWRQARKLALPPNLVASPLAERPYDLRHAAVSTWLNSGVSPQKVAERAGHSVDVLLRVYAKCLDGDDVIANARIERTLNGSDDGGNEA